ncbi:unnamed protein product, partial [Didymodactylos carnosus]
PLTTTNHSKSKTSHFCKEIIYDHEVSNIATPTVDCTLTKSPRKTIVCFTREAPYLQKHQQEQTEIINGIDSTDIDAQNFFLDRAETKIHTTENFNEIEKSSPYSFHFVNENLELHQDLYRDLTVEDEEGYHIGNEGSDDEDECSATAAQKDGTNTATTITEAKSPHLSSVELLKISPYESGICYYIDLHGHASKKGCFVYGNYLQDDDMHTDNLLFAKLISLNSPHFDYDNCNFTVKNMYMKDKREGLSKEGSGRVALYKHLGLIHSYTLECSYAVGKTCQSIPAAENEQFGRISPPCPYVTNLHLSLYSLPQKLTQEHYKDVGKACALAALDILPGQNPFTRVTQSTFRTLQGLRDYLKHQVRTQRNRTNRPSVAATTTTTTNFSTANNRGKQQFQYVSKIVNYNNRPTNFNNNTQPTITNVPSVSNQYGMLSAQSSTSTTKLSNRLMSSNIKFRSNDRRSFNNKRNPSTQNEGNPSDTIVPPLSRIEISARTSSSSKLFHSSPARLQKQHSNQIRFDQTIPSPIIDPALTSRHDLRFGINKLPTSRVMQRQTLSLSSLPVRASDSSSRSTRVGQSAPHSFTKSTSANALKQQPQKHHRLPSTTTHLVLSTDPLLTYKPQNTIQNPQTVLFE